MYCTVGSAVDSAIDGYCTEESNSGGGTGTVHIFDDDFLWA